MPRALLMLLMVSAAVALTACDQHAMMEKFASPEEQATARHYIDQLRHHNFVEIEKSADASISGPALDSTLDKMAALIPSDAPIAVTLVGAHRFSSTAEGDVVNLTFEYRFPQAYVIASLATKSKNGQFSIVGFHVYPETESLESQNRFKWCGKSALHYAVLTYGIAVALLSLAVLIICVRTKMPRRKWLWILFILFGFGQFSINWTTGQWAIQLLTVQLLSVGSHAEFFGPWIISVSLPIGAVLFLVLRRRLKAPGAPPAAAEA